LEWREARPWSLFRLFGYDLYRKVYEDVHRMHLMTERARSKKVARSTLFAMFAGPVTATRADNEELKRGGRPKI
jgi:hypothetical protein